MATLFSEAGNLWAPQFYIVLLLIKESVKAYTTAPSPHRLSSTTTMFTSMHCQQPAMAATRMLTPRMMLPLLATRATGSIEFQQAYPVPAPVPALRLPLLTRVSAAVERQVCPSSSRLAPTSRAFVFKKKREFQKLMEGGPPTLTRSGRPVCPIPPPLSGCHPKV